MYYEEKIINGILHYRTNPFDKWTSKTAEQLTTMLEELREKIKDENLEAKFNDR